MRGQWIGRVLAVAAVVAALAADGAAAGGKALTYVDLMKMRTFSGEVISRDGSWVAYTLTPDRGDGEARVRSTGGAAEHVIERGSDPVISADARWVAASVLPPFAERERAKEKKGKDEGPKNGLVLLATGDGSLLAFERVESFAFSEDGAWLAYQRYAEEDEEAEDQSESGEGEPGAEQSSSEEAAVEPAQQGEPAEEGEPAGEDDADEAEEHLGTTLVVRHLESGREIELAHVDRWAFDRQGRFLAYSVAAPEGAGNGLFALRFDGEEAPAEALHQAERGRYTALAWAEEATALAFAAAVDDEEGEPGHAVVWAWDGAELRAAAASEAAPEGWFVPSVNELAWSRDGARLYLGLKPLDEEVRDDDADTSEEAEGEGTPFDPYDVDAILEDRAVDVWHGDDPLIIPQQKESWEHEKDRTYRAVWHAADGRLVALADRELRQVEPSLEPGASAALGRADTPYLKQLTWYGTLFDLYRVELADGSRQRVAERLDGETRPSLSPDGRWVVYYREPHWYLFDGATGTARNLTAELPVPFADEDDDYPAPDPGYGVADWVVGDGGAATAVLIYDKYDLWQFPVDGGEALNLTAGTGRAEETIYRLLDLDPDRPGVAPGERLLLSAYRDRAKSRGFARATVGERGAEWRVDEEKRFTFLARAEDSDRLLYTRESYREFPDLWVAGLDFEQRTKLSDANPQIAELAWGQASLVHWTSADGLPLDGVLIRPDDLGPDERCPVLVYFYRFFSQRLYEFNEPVINHRPSFPVYASHGYCVFLPDVRFEVGRPGLAAVKSLVPGVQKLVDMGVADPDAVGLHGHSWSGYQAAFVVTQTNIFKAAVAGAPVSNMTSAYGGIRWGSGRARQFQYEQGQSRIGGSLWEARSLYIDNSPLFFADRVETPLLLMFGDDDGAVPWTQGIELYLALRRLGKEVVFLEYRDEPHHPQKYANKLDYSIRMKQFFDHHLKGEPAPEWMTEGVPYRGK